MAGESYKHPPFGTLVDGIVGDILEKKGFISVVKGASKLYAVGGVIFLLNALAGTEIGHMVNEVQGNILADENGPLRPDFLSDELTDQEIYDGTRELFGTDMSDPLNHPLRALSASTGLFTRSIMMHVNGISAEQLAWDTLVVGGVSGGLWVAGKVIHEPYKKWEEKNL